MVCKGTCIRNKASGPISSGRYATGQKRCQICEMYVKWGGLWCPCCGCRLRIGPRIHKQGKVNNKTTRTAATQSSK
jgi:hypothetical protein